MQETDELLLETCLLAGKIMMENGSEVYRVEDTMNRIAANAGEANSISYVTATGIFMGLRSSHYAQVENVHDRVINLEKIVAVNRLSRSFAEKQITLPQLYASLKEINQVTPSFPLWLQVLSAGVVSSTLMIILAAIGLISLLLFHWQHRVHYRSLGEKAIDIRFWICSSPL